MYKIELRENQMDALLALLEEMNDDTLQDLDLLHWSEAVDELYTTVQQACGLGDDESTD